MRQPLSLAVLLAGLLVCLAPRARGVEGGAPAPVPDGAGGLRAHSAHGDFDVSFDKLSVSVRRRLAEQRRSTWEENIAKSRERNPTGPAGGEAPQAPAVRVNEEGKLVGIIREVHSWIQPWQIFEEDLNPDGQTARVTMTGGRVDGAPALFVMVLDAQGRERKRVVVEAFDFHVEQLD